MKKVMQTKLGLSGNCQSAVLASILEMELDDVPYFADGLGEDNSLSETEKDKIFNDRIDKWLATHGLKLQWYEDSHIIQKYIQEEFKNIYYQVCGKSPRGYYHVVVYLNGEMVHDPHPEGGGVYHAPDEQKPLLYGFLINQNC